MGRVCKIRPWWKGSPASKGVVFPWLLAHVSHESKGNVTTTYIHFHETFVVLVYIQLLVRLSTADTHINNPTLSPEMLHCVLYLADSRVRQRETRPWLLDQTHTSDQLIISLLFFLSLDCTELITLFWWLTLAPASNSLWTVSVRPFSAAIPRGTLHGSYMEREAVNWIWPHLWKRTNEHTLTIK